MEIIEKRFRSDACIQQVVVQSSYIYIYIVNHPVARSSVPALRGKTLASFQIEAPVPVEDALRRNRNPTHQQRCYREYVEKQCETLQNA